MPPSMTKAEVTIKSLLGRTHLTPCKDGTSPNDDGWVVVVLLVIPSERHEETSLRIGIDRIVALTAGNDVGTIELDCGIGIDGIIWRQYIHVATIQDDPFLTFDALGTCCVGTHGHIAAVDNDFAFRSNALGRGHILALAAKAHASAFAILIVWVPKATYEVRHSTATEARETRVERYNGNDCQNSEAVDVSAEP